MPPLFPHPLAHPPNSSVYGLLEVTSIAKRMRFMTGVPLQCFHWAVCVLSTHVISLSELIKWQSN